MNDSACFCFSFRQYVVIRAGEFRACGRVAFKIKISWATKYVFYSHCRQRCQRSYIGIICVYFLMNPLKQFIGILIVLHILILQIIPGHIKMKAVLYLTYSWNRFMPLTFIYTKRSVTILSRQHGAYCSVDLVDKSPGTQWLKYTNLFLISWLASSALGKSCWFEMWEKHLPLHFNS